MFLVWMFWKSWNERMSFRNVHITFLCSVIERKRALLRWGGGGALASYWFFQLPPFWWIVEPVEFLPTYVTELNPAEVLQELSLTPLCYRVIHVCYNGAIYLCSSSISYMLTTACCECIGSSNSWYFLCHSSSSVADLFVQVQTH